MRTVKIISGTYGHKPAGASRISPKNRLSEPFMVDDAEAGRIVALGIAEFVDKADAIPVIIPEEIMPHTAAPEPEGGARGAEASSKPAAAKTEDTVSRPEADAVVPDYNSNTNVNTLRQFGKAAGITFKVGTKKTEMIAALNEHYGIGEDETDDGEAPPDLTPEDPVI